MRRLIIVASAVNKPPGETKIREKESPSQISKSVFALERKDTSNCTISSQFVSILPMPCSRLYKRVMVSRRYSKIDIAQEAPIDFEEVMMNLHELRPFEESSSLSAAE